MTAASTISSVETVGRIVMFNQVCSEDFFPAFDWSIREDPAKDSTASVTLLDGSHVDAEAAGTISIGTLTQRSTIGADGQSTLSTYVVAACSIAVPCDMSHMT